MHQRPDESTRTPDRSCFYEAEAVIEGQRYSARSRSGAPFALARVLVAAGVPDGLVSVTHRGLSGDVRYPSLHLMAGRMMTEGARATVLNIPFRDLDLTFGRVGLNGKVGGSKPPPVPLPTPDLESASTDAAAD
jgi:hypothetical protein